MSLSHLCYNFVMRIHNLELRREWTFPKFRAVRYQALIDLEQTKYRSVFFLSTCLYFCKITYTKFVYSQPVYKYNIGVQQSDITCIHIRSNANNKVPVPSQHHSACMHVQTHARLLCRLLCEGRNNTVACSQAPPTRLRHVGKTYRL